MFFNDDGMDDEDDGDDESADSAAPSPTLLHSVSHLLIVDLCNASHLAVAAGALAALEASPGARARLGLLFNPTSDTCVAPAVAAWTAVASATAAADFAPLRTTLALAHAATLGHKSDSPAATSALASAMGSALLPAAARSAAAPGQLGTATRLIDTHSEYAQSLSLARGEGALVVNGRIVHLGADATLDAVDVGLLEEYAPPLHQPPLATWPHGVPPL